MSLSDFVGMDNLYILKLYIIRCFHLREMRKLNSLYLHLNSLLLRIFFKTGDGQRYLRLMQINPN